MIEVDKILNFLKMNNIDFSIEGQIKNTYNIASIFKPVNNGFYFFTGETFLEKINNSLVLTNNNLSLTKNASIKISEDPQEIYYKLISNFYSEKSTGVIQDSSIIHPKAIIGKNVQIDHYCIINECTIEDNVIIKNHCVIEKNTSIGQNSIIENHSNIGARGMAWVWDTQDCSIEKKIILPQLGGVKIGENCILGSSTIIVRGSLNENTTINNNSILAPGCRIGHGTIIGNAVHLANNVITGGNVIIGDYSFIGSSASFRPKVKIDKNTIVGTGSVVIRNTIKENTTIIGVPAKEIETKESPSGMPKLKNNKL